MNAPTRALPATRPGTARRGFDPCQVRDRWLARPQVGTALAQPLTRRLLVYGAGHYQDRERHVAINPHGYPFTVLYLCTSGAASLTAAGVRHRIRAGSAFLVPAGMPFSYEPLELPWSLRWCALLGTDAAELLRMNDGPASPIIHVGDTPHVVGLVDEITAIYEDDAAPCRTTEAAGIAWQLMTRLGIDQSAASPGQQERVLGYLAEHFDEWIPVPALAARLGLSPSRLNDLVRIATGRGVLAYQIELRMAKARRLLAETDDDIARIARAVGYPDPHYFARHFGRSVGTSPTRFRRDTADVT